MADWVSHLPILWMAPIILAGAFLVTFLTYLIVFALAKGERLRAFKAMSPTMLTPLAVVFGLLISFLASQVWSDVNQAREAVLYEASALRTVALLANGLPDEPAARLRALVRRHIDEAVNEEWPAMADHATRLSMVTQADSEALKLVLSLPPQNEVQRLVQHEIADALQDAIDQRRERIVISRSTVNATKWTVVIVLSFLILLTIGIVHSDNRAAAALSMTIFATGVAACLLLISAHNRPFTGQISVSADLLQQAMPEP